MSARNDATERQVQAADPGMSTWLSANAGSGKTRVLTDRVARLLLEGVRPERILCLTFTKAAASEMQNRLFQRLGAWTMMPETQLMEELSSLGCRPSCNRRGAWRRAYAVCARDRNAGRSQDPDDPLLLCRASPALSA